MGAPSAQVQSSQSSQPASKGAGTSASTPSGSGKGSMAATSGQPQIGAPNTYGNTGMAPVDSPGFTTISDMSKVSSNLGPVSGPVAMGQPITMDGLRDQLKTANDQRTFYPAPMQTAPKAYPNTVGPILDSTVSGAPTQANGQLGLGNALNNMGSVAGGQNGQPMAKGSGGGQGGGKGSVIGGLNNGTYHPGSGPKGPGATY